MQPQSRSGRFAEDRPLLPLQGIEPTFDGCPAPVRTPASVPAAGVSRHVNLLQIVKSRSEPIGTAAVGAPVTSAATVALLYRQMFFTCPVAAVCCVRTCIIGSVTIA